MIQRPLSSAIAIRFVFFDVFLDLITEFSIKVKPVSLGSLMLNLFKDIVSIPCFFNKALISRTLPRLWLATTIFLGN